MPDDATQGAGSVSLTGHRASFGTKGQIGYPCIPGIAEEAGIGILVRIHRPVHVPDGVPLAVKILAEGVVFRPHGNPFPDGGGIDIGQQRHHAVHHKRTHGATAVHGGSERQQVFGTGNTLLDGLPAAGGLDQFHRLLLPAQAAHLDDGRTLFGRSVLRNGHLDGNRVFGSGSLYREQLGPGLACRGHPVFGTEYAECDLSPRGLHRQRGRRDLEADGGRFFHLAARVRERQGGKEK